MGLHLVVRRSKISHCSVHSSSLLYPPMARSSWSLTLQAEKLPRGRLIEPSSCHLHIQDSILVLAAQHALQGSHVCAVPVLEQLPRLMNCSSRVEIASELWLLVPQHTISAISPCKMLASVKKPIASLNAEMEGQPCTCQSGDRKARSLPGASDHQSHQHISCCLEALQTPEQSAESPWALQLSTCR